MHGGPIPILLFHKITSPGQEPGEPFATPADTFAEHLRWLHDEGVATLTLAELRQRVDGTAEAPADRPEVVLTFDDGTDCMGTRAAPLLDERGFRAAGFVITDRVGTEGYLGWDELNELQHRGPIEIHTHSHSHQKWPFGAETVPVITEEIQRSRQLLSHHLAMPESTFDTIAWPYGRSCPEWEDAATEAGLPMQMIVQRGSVVRQGQLQRLPRLLADGMSATTFRRWVSTLLKPTPAGAANQVFGAIRELRGRGTGYRALR